MSVENLTRTMTEFGNHEANTVSEKDTGLFDARIDHNEVRSSDEESLRGNKQDVFFDPDSRADVSKHSSVNDSEHNDYDPDNRIKVNKSDRESIDDQREYNDVPRSSDDGRDIKKSEAELLVVLRIKEEYANELKEMSDHPETIDEDAINNMDIKEVSPEEVKAKREEFDDIKKDLKKEWEKIHNMEWPKYEEDIYSDNGKLIRKKGSDYDVHHIQPLSKGGENKVENITPLHVNNHYDSKGVHSPDGACSKMK